MAVRWSIFKQERDMFSTIKANFFAFFGQKRSVNLKPLGTKKKTELGPRVQRHIFLREKAQALAAKNTIN